MSSHSNEDTQQFELEQNRATCAGLTGFGMFKVKKNIKNKKEQNKQTKEKNSAENYKKEK